jgi:hypothetical protein
MRLPAALSACLSACRGRGGAGRGTRGLPVPARRVPGRRGGMDSDRHLRLGRGRRGGTCRWVRAWFGGTGRRWPVPALRAGALPGARGADAGARSACPWLAVCAVRSGGRARRRGGRGDPCPRLGRGLLGGGAHVRRHRVPASLDLALGAGSRHVPRIGEEHADGDRDKRRYEPGTALAAQPSAQSYPPLHNYAPSHGNGAYQPALTTGGWFPGRFLPRNNFPITKCTLRVPDCHSAVFDPEMPLDDREDRNG